MDLAFLVVGMVMGFTAGAIFGVNNARMWFKR